MIARIILPLIIINVECKHGLSMAGLGRFRVNGLKKKSLKNLNWFEKKKRSGFKKIQTKTKLNHNIYTTLQCGRRRELEAFTLLVNLRFVHTKRLWRSFLSKAELDE